MKLSNNFNWKEDYCLKKLCYKILFSPQSAINLIQSSFWAQKDLKGSKYSHIILLEMKILNVSDWKEEKCLKKLCYKKLFNLESAINLILFSFWAQKDLNVSFSNPKFNILRTCSAYLNHFPIIFLDKYT